MKLRSLTGLMALLLFPALLPGCSDDATGPVDDIYAVQNVIVDGSSRTLPGTLYQGGVNCGTLTTCSIRYELRRGTLILRHDGQYEFSGSYHVTETSNPARFTAFSVGAVEDGTYARTGDAITFRVTSSSASPEIGSYLSDTGTLQNNTLTVNVLEPLFEEDVHTYTFAR